VRLLPEGEIKVKLLENHWVEIVSDRKKYKLVGMAKENFPALPVRTGENVFAWVAAHADHDAHLEHVRLLGRSTRWTHDLLPLLAKHLARGPEQLHLGPTARSRLR